MLCGKNHSLAFLFHKFARLKIKTRNNMFAYEIFREKMSANPCHDLALPVTCDNLKEQKLFTFLGLFLQPLFLQLQALLSETHLSRYTFGGVQEQIDTEVWPPP